MSDDFMVNWKDFDVAKVSIEKPDSKSFDNTAKGGQKGNYAIAELKYLYRKANGAEVKEKLYLEQPRVTCNGFQMPSDKNSGTSIMCIYDISDPEIIQFLSKMDQLYMKIVELTIPYKNDMKCPKLSRELAPAIINPLIYRPKDLITDQIDPTKKPTQYYKLRDFKNQRTQFFRIAENKSFEWENLQSSEFSGYPLICFDRLYSNGTGKITIQSYTSSFVVLPGELRALGSVNRQRGTIQRIKESDPEAERKQEQDLDRLNSLNETSSNSVTVSVHQDHRNDAPLTETPTSLENRATAPTPAPTLNDVLRNPNPVALAPVPAPVMVVPQQMAPVPQVAPQGLGFNLPTGFPINLTPHKTS
jgi:hypothetical protein